MDLRSDLIARADAFCREHGISKARLAKNVMNDNKFFARIERGEGGFTSKTYEKFLAYFADHKKAAA